MHHFEYYPVLIEAHRRDLRALAAHTPEGVTLPSRRQAIGHLIVRLGAWLEGHRPEASTASPAMRASSAASG